MHKTTIQNRQDEPLIQNPYASHSRDTNFQISHENESATKIQRFLAAVVDIIINFVVTITFFIATGMIDSIQPSNIPSFKVIFPGSVFNFVMFMIIHGYFLKKYGQTVGKRLLGIFIADLNSKAKAEFKVIVLLRLLPITLLSIIPIIGSLLALIDVLFIFRKDKRCVHDLIAKTVVLKTKK